MKIEADNLKLYLLDNTQQLYHAVGHVSLYNMEGKIAGTIMIDIPRCCFDEYNQKLIGLQFNEETGNGQR